MKAIGAVLFAFAAALAAMGFWMMEKQAASAARGGGLLGGLGEMTIGIAILIAVVGATLLFVSIRRKDSQSSRGPISPRA